MLRACHEDKYSLGLASFRTVLPEPWNNAAPMLEPFLAALASYNLSSGSPLHCHTELAVLD